MVDFRLVSRIAASVLVLAVLTAACSTQPAASTEPTTTAFVEPVTTLPPPSPTTTSSTTTTVRAVPPPPLAVSLAAGDIVDGYVQTITGETLPGAAVTVNGEDVPVEADGSFVAGPWFNTIGANAVMVTARNEAGSSSRRIPYTFEPSEGWAAAIGDSVMLGSKNEIEKRISDGIVDATVSRQFLEAPKLVQRLVAGERTPELIIIGLGTNGPVQTRHFDEVMDIAADVPLVAFVNVRVPRSWEGTSNREIEEGVARYDNAVLVDWYGVTADRDDLFARDGVHPKQAGRVIMGELIAEAVFPQWVPLED